jgi:hypothetical protein
MSLDKLVENIKNIFQGRGQQRVVEPPFVVQSEQKDIQPVPDADTVAAIAAALHLSGRTESAANPYSDTAAAIAMALHLHLTQSDSVHVSDKKSYVLSPWSQYGREQIQNARFQVFNRPASSEKSILIRQR